MQKSFAPTTGGEGAVIIVGTQEDAERIAKHEYYVKHYRTYKAHFQTERGKAAIKKYDSSKKGKIRHSQYNRTKQGKARRVRYYSKQRLLEKSRYWVKTKRACWWPRREE
jgi:GH15 family glucan-1,4-alpha-glucosidase